jgi:3-hydroxyisobutyrate dehydrogenase-like beta-hydroxyacid dehydrogenase
MTGTGYGFIGLGNMGGPMAANLAAAGFELTAYDAAGTESRSPARAAIASTSADLAARAETVMMSLPDGAVSLAVAHEIVVAPERIVQTVIDFSTVGLAASREVHAVLAEAGIAYIDAPVSGGTRGAREGTLTVIWAGSEALLSEHRTALEAMAGNVFHVGGLPGQGQAMKLLNNYLSAVAMAATSEAMAFGLSEGLDFATMLDVVNVSTGRNEATRDKFPARILSGTYDAGFHMALMTKDMVLYRDSVRTAGTAREVGEIVADLWQRADKALPGADFTHIFEFVRDRSEGADEPS